MHYFAVLIIYFQKNGPKLITACRNFDLYNSNLEFPNNLPINYHTAQKSAIQTSL